MFKCDICEKSYLSMPALGNHKNTKHSSQTQPIEKKSRGRPRKYEGVPKAAANPELEYTNYFKKDYRKKIEGEEFNMADIAKLIFDDIFVKFSDKIFNPIIHYTDNPILYNIFNEVQPVDKPKETKMADDIFYEYVKYSKENVNKNYFILVVKFIILFRECFNNSHKIKSGEAEILKKEFSAYNNAETLPDLCNEFVTEFMELNNYFGIESVHDRDEIIDIIQHFCAWLFLKGYTASRLTKVA